MIFSCFPPEGKCEWDYLRDFVAQFNAIYGTAYTRSKCLDVENSTGKEPELLLEAPGERKSVVIERKSVVWPRNYFSDHHNEHYLFDHFMSKLYLHGNPFKDSVYHLIFSAEDLKGKGKKEVNSYAEQIAHVVLSYQPNAKSRRGIRSHEPIPWRFCPLSPQERDETVPETGIDYLAYDPFEMPGSSETFQRIEMARAGYAQEFERLSEDAAKKFAKYADCVYMKLLLVQFYGDGLSVPDEAVTEIIQSAQLPEMIDQVWLAHQKWVSLNDYEIAWELVREDNSQRGK